MLFIPSELIKKKREGEVHSPEEIEFLIQQFTDGNIPDYQMSSWLMAVFFQGAADSETATLTEAMKNSGVCFNFSSLEAPCVDKHSTGGIGDKTSLILGPIAAAAGVPVPMIAGRSLGYTGGTLDKLESIPGFRVMLDKKETEDNVRNMGLAMIGQTKDICPADRKIYALRGVTATIESYPLICASIMSKKLAEDLKGLVLDVKFGSGAFMKSYEEGQELADLLIKTGEAHQVHTIVLLTSMNQPLGRYIGNSLEVKEAVEIMKGDTCFENGIDFYEDTRILSLELAGYMIWMGGQASSPEEGVVKATEVLESGRAYEKFLELCQYQGPARLDELSLAKNYFPVLSPSDGVVNQIHVEQLGWTILKMGGAREFCHDTIDHKVGLEWCCRVGQKVHRGQPLAKIHCDDPQKAQEAVEDVSKTVILGGPCPPIKLVQKKMGRGVR